MGYTRAKYRVIKSLTPRYTIQALCVALGVSRSGYYDWLKRTQRLSLESDEVVSKLILQCQIETRYTYGYRRVKIWIERKANLKLNHKRILRVMNKYDLCAKIRRRRSFCKFVSNTIKYENQLKRNFTATALNQKWVTDLTQFRTLNGTVYASAIKDLRDGYIVGCIASKDASTRTVTRTIEAAKQLLVPGNDRITILHSDQGTQYTSCEYKEYLKDLPISASMSRPGNPIDNSPIESFFSSMKTEWLTDTNKLNADEVIEDVKNYVHFYNNSRYQLRSKMTPAELRFGMK